MRTLRDEEEADEAENGEGDIQEGGLPPGQECTKQEL